MCGNVTVGERELSPHAQLFCAPNNVIGITKISLHVCLTLESSKEDTVSPLLWEEIGDLLQSKLHPQTLHTDLVLPRSTERIICVELYLQLNNSSELLLGKPHWLCLYCFITVARSNARSILSWSSWCPDSL